MPLQLQLPPEQLPLPLLHVTPQAPQSFALVCMLTHALLPPHGSLMQVLLPLQSVSPPGQAQAPPEQVAPGSQTVPQVPQ